MRLGGVPVVLQPPLALLRCIFRQRVRVCVVAVEGREGSMEEWKEKDDAASFSTSSSPPNTSSSSSFECSMALLSHHEASSMDMDMGTRKVRRSDPQQYGDR